MVNELMGAKMKGDLLQSMQVVHELTKAVNKPVTIAIGTADLLTEHTFHPISPDTCFPCNFS